MEVRLLRVVDATVRNMRAVSFSCAMQLPHALHAPPRTEVKHYGRPTTDDGRRAADAGDGRRRRTPMTTTEGFTA
eukprot:3704264-Pyramimonas_sp.AAC.1